MDNIEKQLVSSDSDDEIEFSSRKNNRRQALRIVESDSEVENLSTVNEALNTSKILNENESSKQSDESDVSNAAEDDIELSSRRKKKKKRRSDDRKGNSKAISEINSLCDQDSSSDESNNHISMDTRTTLPPLAKINSLCDQDSSSDNSDKQDHTETVPETKRAPQRMSAKQAEEQMKIIQSESQRMARERNLRVPYHKPKQHSLKEFLNRKTINKPIPIALTKKAAATIKMSKEELEQYAKSLEDRNKESQEFYRSDTDESLTNDTQNDSKTQAEHVNLDVDINEQEVVEASTANTEELRAEINLDVVENCTDSTTLNDSTLNNKVEIPENASTNCSNHKTIEIDYNFGEEDTNEKNAATRFNSIVKPCLKDPVNGIIDLDFDDVISTKSGGDELFERFIRHVAKKPTRTEREISILSTDNGVIEMKNVKIESDNQDSIHSKPRTDRFKLKEELSLRIAAKRKEELLKKQIAIKEVVVEDDDSDLENPLKSKLIENELKVVEVDECEGIEKLTNEEKNDEADVDENDEETCVDEDEGEDDKPVEDNDDEESGDEYDNNIECDPHESNESMELIANSSGDENVIEFPKQRKRIIVMDNSDDEEPNESRELIENVDDVNSHSQEEQQIDQTTSQISKNQDLADRMIDLCSEIVPEKNYLDNNIGPLYTQTTDNISESQLLDLCSGTFATQPIKTCEASCAELNSEHNSYNLSDNEFSDDDIGVTNKAKQRKRINISDDEAENISQDDKAILKDDADETDAEEYLSDEEAENRIVEYDSEENEIEVSVQPKKKISEFFENEAELSESEWGSADEDENNLDKFEIELGDEDEFDQDKLHSDIERIHRRRMADQDAREVRIIKETLFEDEEENGLGRQRQFKWKHMENSLNIEENKDDDKDDAVLKSDDENEETWRRMRHERNNLLQETKNQIDVVVLADETITKRKKRISIIKNPVNVNNTVTKDLSFLISKMKEEQTNRSSLLIRDEATLANLSKIITDDGIPSINANSKNFLFNVISSDDGKLSGKRKLDSTNDDGVENKDKAQKTKRVKKSRLSVLDRLC